MAIAIRNDQTVAPTYQRESTRRLPMRFHPERGVIRTEHGWQFVVQVPSRSNPATRWDVLIREDGSTTCQCPKFYFRGECHHVPNALRFLEVA